MATPTMAIVQIMRARRENRPPPSRHIDAYRPVYRRVLETLHEHGGEGAVDELTAWIVDETHATGELPDPDAVIERARSVVRQRDLAIPEGSELAT